MPTFNFMAQFVDKIEDGSKGGTIRKYRRYPTREGQTLYLQTGPRFKPVRIKAVPCVEVWDVQITEQFVQLKRFIPSFTITVGNPPKEVKTLDHWQTVLLDTTSELNQFAKSDGFDSWSEMKKFWKGGLPFTGFNARWIHLDKQITYSI